MSLENNLHLFPEMPVEEALSETRTVFVARSFLGDDTENLELARELRDTEDILALEQSRKKIQQERNTWKWQLDVLQDNSHVYSFFSSCQGIQRYLNHLVRVFLFHQEKLLGSQDQLPVNGSKPHYRRSSSSHGKVNRSARAHNAKMERAWKDQITGYSESMDNHPVLTDLFDLVKTVGQAYQWFATRVYENHSSLPFVRERGFSNNVLNATSNLTGNDEKEPVGIFLKNPGIVRRLVEDYLERGNPHLQQRQPRLFYRNPTNYTTVKEITPDIVIGIYAQELRTTAGG